VPDLDVLLEEGRRTLDQKKRKEIYDRVQIMILDHVPHIWLYSADTIDFTQASVKGFRQHPTTQLYGLEGAWIDRA
jgi:peptide/nickel transport system substrate-binding protein